jgi:hypothetical protein
VKRVVPDTTKRILRSSADDHFLAESTFTIPWGIDR